MKHTALFVVIVVALLIVSLVFFINRDRKTQMTADPLSGSPIPTNPIDNPTPTQPASIVPSDWVSYSSVEYGFMIQFPSDIQHDTTTEGERFFKLGPSQTTGTELYDGISVLISSGNLNGDDFKNFVDRQYAEVKNDPVEPRVGDLMTMTLGGKAGYSFTVNSIGDRTDIYLPKGDAEYLHIINGTVEPENRNQQYQKIVETMLSSLVYE